jgi:ADP-ribose pyrophosphatase
VDKAVVWSGKFLETVVDGRWEYVQRRDDAHAAMILAETDAGALVLVEQYRPPLGGRCLEFPAGLVDAGEDGADAARRELEEETGYRAADIESVGVFASSPGLTSETFTLYRARGLSKVGDGGGIDGEEIEVFEVPRAHVCDFIRERRRRGVAVDARLVAVLALA